MRRREILLLDFHGDLADDHLPEVELHSKETTPNWLFSKLREEPTPLVQSGPTYAFSPDAFPDVG